jgi:hypothetical protein
MLVPLDILELIVSKSSNGYVHIKQLCKILEVPKVIRYGDFSIPDIICVIPKAKHKILGYSVSMQSVRLQLFKEQYESLGHIECVKCKRMATHFSLEGQFGVTPHLNLYGDDMLFTKDHIMPRSLGGSDELRNLQVMCSKCNEAKGNLEEKIC